jgi:hypothetical protein
VQEAREALEDGNYLRARDLLVAATAQLHDAARDLEAATSPAAKRSR